MTRGALGTAWAVVTLLAAACGRGAGGDAADAAHSAAASDPLVMPAYPDGERGRLVTRSAGGDTLDGSWLARAGVCADPGLLQVLADQGDIGTVLLVRYTDTGVTAGAYAVRPADSALAPGTGRLGVQVFRARRAVALAAAAGSVVIERVAPAVNGRFAVRLRNLSTFDSVLYAGVFQGLAAESLPPSLCPSLAPDSAVSSAGVDPLH